MTPPVPAARLPGLLPLATALCACATAAAPWGATDGVVPARHAEVRTLNQGYRRTASQVLVRAALRPTRANLDWAAYHANFMISDAPPEAGEAPRGRGRVTRPFAGAVDDKTLTSSIARTPLTDQERSRPLALAPLLQFLTQRDAKLAAGLDEVVAAVRAELWGTEGAPHLPRQGASELYVHDVAGGSELWVKIEFQPWFQGLGRLPDEDGDGHPELYGRVRSDLVAPDAVAVIRGDYTSKLLTAAEVKAWSNQLSSYWYPSYNTDLVAAGGRWPDGETEVAIRKELGDAAFERPTVVMRGKPNGQPTYNVFIVEGLGATVAGGASGVPMSAPARPAGKPSPRPEPVALAIEGELASHGGTWGAWSAKVKAYDNVVRQRLRATPAKVKALPGEDGFLFYRTALESTVGGDLEKQPSGKNPLPVIVEWKRMLEARGVDFLFVPVPSKVEVYPDQLDTRLGPLAGQVVNPYVRKLALALGRAGVEVLDLWPPLLAGRAGHDQGGEPLYQRQDTHWGQRGMALAARAVAARVKEYPWYRALAKERRTYQTKAVSFTRHGDLHSRLADVLKKRYPPEALTAQQVLATGGKPYEDDPDSPIVLLGDSFTAVYQLTDCQSAGISAQIAREIGHPVDLVMSYGGGPNVRQKLLRRGAGDLARKRLVIWMMTARDLHRYWEDWEPLPVAK